MIIRSRPYYYNRFKEEIISLPAALQDGGGSDGGAGPILIGDQSWASINLEIT